MERKRSGRKPVVGNFFLGDLEDVGTQMLASDLPVSGMLDSSPPLSAEMRFALDPVPNRALLNARPFEEFSNPPGQLALASAVFDGPLKSGNVRGFVHEEGGYTRILVAVNKEGCFTADKDPCKVIDMNQARAKKQLPPKKASKKAAAGIGPDGMTLAQRLHRLMVERGIGQTELARMCSEYYAAFVPGSEDKFKQQHIFNVLQGQSTAEVLPILAAVLDVSPLWLQLGIGNTESKK